MFGIFKKSCHFELSLESEKSIRILKYALNLWILRFLRKLSMARQNNKEFVILSVSEKSKEF